MFSAPMSVWALEQLVKRARRNGVAKAEARRMRADALRWYCAALDAGHLPEDVQLVLECERPGHCRMAVVVLGDPVAVPPSAMVH